MSTVVEQYGELDLFIRSNYAPMYAVALKLTSSPAAAEDIVQEVILKFWENRSRYATLDSIGNYIFVMVRNESLNYLRSRKREDARHAALRQPENDGHDILNKLIEEEINTMVLSAIDGLPEQSARVMRLSLSGMNNAQIAKLLAVSVNTVKTLKYIAMRKLRGHFIKMDI